MNKFLQNLNQRGSTPVPVPAPPIRSSTSPPAGSVSAGSPSADYDPIRRLTEELSRHSGAIEGLTALIMDMNERPQAATQAELQTLLEAARAGVTHQLKATDVATLLLPKLTAGMPNTENIKAVADESAKTITDAAAAATKQIAQSGTAAASEIRQAARQKANDFAQLFGFTSWKSALLIGLIPLLSGGGLFYLWQERQRQQTELTAWKSFGLWVSEKYPEVRKVYDRSSQ